MKNKYNTRQREGILKYLKDNQNSNVTAEEIINHFKSNGENIGKSTVYRFLNDLVEQKMIKKYMVEGRNCSCYQYIEDHNCDEHFHLKCEKCNKIIHLECEEFKDVQEHIAKEHKFKLDNVKTVFYGICDDCKKENNKKR